MLTRNLTLCDYCHKSARLAQGSSATAAVGGRRELELGRWGELVRTHRVYDGSETLGLVSSEAGFLGDPIDNGASKQGGTTVTSV